MAVFEEALRGKVVLAGVGVVGRGDDGVGPLLARRLANAGRLCALDCGERLEDYTGDIARERPDTVLIADAVEMGRAPGSVALLEAEDLSQGGSDTHRASLRAVMEYLAQRTGAAVYLCGIQPRAVADRRALSEPVEAALEALARLLESGPGTDETRPAAGQARREGT